MVKIIPFLLAGGLSAAQIWKGNYKFKTSDGKCIDFRGAKTPLCFLASTTHEFKDDGNFWSNGGKNYLWATPANFGFAPLKNKRRSVLKFEKISAGSGQWYIKGTTHLAKGKAIAWNGVEGLVLIDFKGQFNLRSDGVLTFDDRHCYTTEKTGKRKLKMLACLNNDNHTKFTYDSATQQFKSNDDAGWCLSATDGMQRVEFGRCDDKDNMQKFEKLPDGRLKVNGKCLLPLMTGIGYETCDDLVFVQSA